MLKVFISCDIVSYCECLGPFVQFVVRQNYDLYGNIILCTNKLILSRNI